MRLFLSKLLVTTALLTAASLAANADAIPVTPSEEGSSVEVDFSAPCTSNFFSCWIEVELADSLGEFSQNLDDGESWEFDFFDVFVGGVGHVENLTIEATLAFLSPFGTASSTGEGGFSTIFGLISGGWLTWGDAGRIDLDDGSWLTIAFEDVLVGGLGNYTTVSALVSYHGAVSVPEPGTMALLGFALVFLGLTRVRRRAISGN